MNSEIVPDDRAGSVVVVDGHPQSLVHLDDPEDLAFEYVAAIAAGVDATFGRPERLRVTHVGGAGLTLARWVQATRPGSPQIVLEPDAALTELVRRDLPLPRGHRIRVRPVDGASGVAALATASADVLIVDAYAEGRVPAELGALPFLTDAARVLAAGGLLAVNVADEPSGRYLARVAAGVRAAVGPCALVATTEVVKGRRFGNRVLLARLGATVDLHTLRRAVARLPWPCGVLADADLTRRHPGAVPFTGGADVARSPKPPDPGRGWRVR